MEKNTPQSDLDKENLSTIMIDDPCMKQIPVHVLCIFSNTMLYMYITSHVIIRIYSNIIFMHYKN